MVSRPAVPPDAANVLGRGFDGRRPCTHVAPPADFGIARSVSRPGNPHDSAVVESTSHILKRELIAGGRFGSDEELRAALFDWANWHDNFRVRSTLGCMSPIEFREAGLIIS